MYLCPSAHKDSKGLTLVEIVLAMVIASIIGLVLFTTFSQGAKLWSKANKVSPQIELQIVFEKLGNDFRNIFTDSLGSVQGKSEELSFFSLVNQARNKRNSFGEFMEPVKVKYFYDPISKNLYREVRNYLSSEKNVETKKVVVGGLQSFEFLYYDAPSRKGAVRWVRNWFYEYPPRAIKVIMKVSRGAGKQPLAMERVYDIPQGIYNYL